MFDTGYNPKSCRADNLPFYSPIQAALRWCGLVSQETTILYKTAETSTIKPADFPQWPCLKANYDRIIHAMNNGVLPYGREGTTVSSGHQVAPARRTINHDDLKKWLTEYYPDQKPKFLFDEFEQSTHSAITKEAYLALKAERDRFKLQSVNLNLSLSALVAEKDRLVLENAQLKQLLENGQNADINPKSKTTALQIIELLATLTTPLDLKQPTVSAHMLHTYAASIGKPPPSERALINWFNEITANSK